MSAVHGVLQQQWKFAKDPRSEALCREEFSVRCVRQLGHQQLTVDGRRFTNASSSGGSALSKHAFVQHKACKQQNSENAVNMLHMICSAKHGDNRAASMLAGIEQLAHLQCAIKL